MRSVVLGLGVAIAVVGCSAAGVAPFGSPAALRQAQGDTVPDGSGRYIKHVVILIQENRSFDDFFATFPGADGTKTGLAARPSASPTTVPLTPVDLVTGVGNDLGHGYKTFVKEYDDGKMDGWSLLGGTINPYQYVRKAQIEPYWSLAKQYVLADHMFQTEKSASFTSHLDLIAGTAAVSANASIVDQPAVAPWGCDAPAGTVTSLLNSSLHILWGQGPFPCFKWKTMADLLDANHVSWKYYVKSWGTGSIWNGFDAIRAIRCGNATPPCLHTYGPEWTTHISEPETNVFTDITSGKLPAVSWVIPDGLNSDHPGYAKDTGPSWVAQVVNAVGKSKYWKSTAILVVWDDWGGFYDHVKPPQLDYAGLAFRVPFIIVSPYSRKSHFSHTYYEFGSILKFVENNWSLGRLGGYATDARATSIIDAFDFNQPARSFVTIPAKYSKAFFLKQAPSDVPLDDE